MGNGHNETSFLTNIIIKYFNKENLFNTSTIFPVQAPVAHACDPNYPEVEIRRIMAQSQPRQIVCETLS
jgi:hypothetical protein